MTNNLFFTVKYKIFFQIIPVYNKIFFYYFQNPGSSVNSLSDDYQLSNFENKMASPFN